LLDHREDPSHYANDGKVEKDERSSTHSGPSISNGAAKKKHNINSIFL
jgi:hypothetical protein